MNRTHTAPTAEAEQRLRDAVYHTAADGQRGLWDALNAYRDFIRVCAVAELGCRNKSKRGTCVDKGFNAICFACQAEVERDRIVVAVLAL